jgi:hypothetical protein
MSGRSQNRTPNVPPIWGAAQLDLERCMEIATGDRWLSLDGGLDPAAVRAVLDGCYRVLRAEVEKV